MAPSIAGTPLVVPNSRASSQGASSRIQPRILRHLSHRSHRWLHKFLVAPPVQVARDMRKVSSPSSSKNDSGFQKPSQRETHVPGNLAHRILHPHLWKEDQAHPFTEASRMVTALATSPSMIYLRSGTAWKQAWLISD
ncbi:hypothetical protein YC2023_090566 [Brassica napus]